MGRFTFHQFRLVTLNSHKLMRTPNQTSASTINNLKQRLAIAERKVELMDRFANETGGDLGQISWLTMQMLAIAGTLELPADKTLKDLAAWAVTFKSNLSKPK